MRTTDPKDYDAEDDLTMDESPPDTALILGPCDGCGEPVVDGFVQIDAAKGMLWHWGCRPLDEEGG